jgi:nitrogen permease regulator 2-like protein
MMIDIFQYSNMYTLRKSIQWLAEEPHVVEECGAYVTKEGRSFLCPAMHLPTFFCPGKPLPDWPALLHLYSRLKPGKTVMEWVNEFEIYKHGIDVRRFVSFGVIKVSHPCVL